MAARRVDRLFGWKPSSQGIQQAEHSATPACGNVTWWTPTVRVNGVRGRRRQLVGAGVLAIAILGSILLPSTSLPYHGCLQVLGPGHPECPPLNHHDALRLLIRLIGLAVASGIVFWPRVRRLAVGLLALAGLGTAIGRRRLGGWFASGPGR